MVYNGYYKVMSNIPKMGHLTTPVNPPSSPAAPHGPFPRAAPIPKILPSPPPMLLLGCLRSNDLKLDVVYVYIYIYIHIYIHINDIYIYVVNMRIIYGYFMVNDGYYIYIKYLENVLYYVHHICTSDHFLH